MISISGTLDGILHGSAITLQFKIEDGKAEILGGDSLSVYNPSGFRGDDSKFYDKVGIILGIIRSIGMIVSIGALIAIGIKSMTLSANEKAVYKQALPGYLLGAFMIFAITWIPQLVYNLTKEL